jgi:Holliday junction resolvase RusA-like endonuclease
VERGHSDCFFNEPQAPDNGADIPRRSEKYAGGKGMKNFGIIVCQDCGKETIKTGPTQNYCPNCSKKRDIARKKKWAINNPVVVTHEESLENHKKSVSTYIKRGLAINKKNKKSIFYAPDVDLQWHITLAIPFSYAVSKNHIWATNGKGHIHRRKESTDYEDYIILEFKKELQGKKVFQNKIWIDLFVQKPNHKGDAINVLDLIADALKKAVGIDDRWFSVRWIDWEVVKENQKIYIGIGQEDTWDAKLCSYCGRILPLEYFGKARRECKECTNGRKKHKFKTGEELNDEYMTTEGEKKYEEAMRGNL